MLFPGRFTPVLHACSDWIRAANANRGALFSNAFAGRKGVETLRREPDLRQVRIRNDALGAQDALTRRLGSVLRVEQLRLTQLMAELPVRT